MKRLVTLITIFLTSLLLIFSETVYAWQTGGQASGGGSSGGGASIWTDGGSTFDSGTYLFQLVYKPQNGNRSVISCAVVYAGQHRGNIGNIYSKAMGTSSANGCRYVTDGALKDLALNLYGGAKLDNLPVISDRDIAQRYIADFGVDYGSLTQPGSDPGNINSYGYRILIQKLTCYGVSGDWCQVLYPRKEFANDYPNNLLFGASFQNDLYTTVDDIGIHRSAYTSWNTTRGNCWGDLCTSLGRNFANWNQGEGYNIIGFDSSVFNSYDYTIDAACTNCQDTTSNSSFIIQDINNWDAIERSKDYSGENDNIKGYYYKNDNTYCREEIKVDFPDVGKPVNVKTGRYFTVGATEEELEPSGLEKNFGDITVTRTRECQGDGANAYTQSHPFGTETANEGTIDKGTGKVKLKYQENVLNGSQYDQDSLTLVAKDCQSTVNGGTRTMTCNYGLSENVYRYIKDGQSIFSPKAEEMDTYVDLGIANLPISFNNFSVPRANVQLTYELPNDSQLKKSYVKNNSYLANENVENIYSKYINGKMNGDEDQNELNKSACAKLYDLNTTGFKNCAQNRTDNKIGNNDSVNCIARNTFNEGDTLERYICPIIGTSLEELACTYDSKTDTYYGKNGTKVSKEKFEEQCLPDNNDKVCKYDPDTDIYYGQNGDPVTKEEFYEQCPQSCVVIDGKYYGKEGKPVEEDVYIEECLNDGNCPPEQCTYGCCPDGSCADSDGNCPFIPGGPPGSGNIIYRPIDLINPFPGQSGALRATGDNWCSYNINTKTIDCSADNPIVYKHINNNRSHDDFSIYNTAITDPLYEVELTPDTMKQIRKYNDRQESSGGYGDYTLNCKNKTVGCYSTFLRESGLVTITGECDTKSSIASCAENK